MEKALKNKTRYGIYAPVIFLFFVLYSFVIVNRMKLPQVKGTAYAYHTVDYGMGFCSKFLPGTVYRLITGDCSPASATVFNTVFFLLIFAGASLLLAKFLCGCGASDRLPAAAAVLFFVSGPCSMTSYTLNLGMLDIWWFFFSVLFIFFLQYKPTRFLLPLFAFLSIAIHFGALLNFIPMCALLLLYEITRCTTKKEKTTLAFIFFAFIAIALFSFIYFNTHDSKNIKLTVDGFRYVLIQRGVKDPKYFLFEIFGTSDTTSVQHLADASGLFDIYSGADYAGLMAQRSGNVLEDLFRALILQIKVHLDLMVSNASLKRVLWQLLALLLLLAPVCFVMLRIIYRKKKQTENKLEKFIFLCMFAMLPYGSIFSLFLSTDSVRWTIMSFFCLFTLLLYMAYKEKTAIISLLREETKRFSPPLIRIYYIIYAVTVFTPFV